MQTLFTSDRMIVKGKIREYKFTKPGGAPNFEMEEGEEKTLSLEFIFQVNGRITQYSYDFHLGPDDESTTSDDLTLVNWYEWYPLAELFFSMGYNFGTNPFRQESGIMRNWINTCGGTKSK